MSLLLGLAGSEAGSQARGPSSKVVSLFSFFFPFASLSLSQENSYTIVVLVGHGRCIVIAVGLRTQLE
jgi:hypothetical protein